MEDQNASLLERLYEKLGRATELSMNGDMDDSDYWNGHVDALLDLIGEETGQDKVLIRAEVQEAFIALSFAERVNEVTRDA